MEGNQSKEQAKETYTPTAATIDGQSTISLYGAVFVFEHPATFETIALEPEKKQRIIDDLITFNKSKDYYARTGKAWKRGYLLYSPPGTGKSNAANLLSYDVYDLELTAVKDNNELRSLLIETTNKSIIAIEDIDCSLDLTGQRKKKEEKSSEGKKVKKEISREETSKVLASEFH